MHIFHLVQWPVTNFYQMLFYPRRFSQLGTKCPQFVQVQSWSYIMIKLTISGAWFWVLSPPPFSRWVWATFEGSLEETFILLSSRFEMHVFHLVQWPVTKYINCSCSGWSISALNWNIYAVNLPYLQSAWPFSQISTFSFTVSLKLFSANTTGLLSGCFHVSLTISELMCCVFIGHAHNEYVL